MYSKNNRGCIRRNSKNKSHNKGFSTYSKNKRRNIRRMIKNILKMTEDIKRTHSSSTIGLFDRAVSGRALCHKALQRRWAKNKRGHITEDTFREHIL